MNSPAGCCYCERSKNKTLLMSNMHPSLPPSCIDSLPGLGRGVGVVNKDKTFWASTCPTMTEPHQDQPRPQTLQTETACKFIIYKKIFTKTLEVELFQDGKEPLLQESHPPAGCFPVAKGHTESSVTLSCRDSHSHTKCIN